MSSDSETFIIGAIVILIFVVTFIVCMWGYVMLQLKSNKEPGRNEPCPCKSGLKYKVCHGDALKKEVCNRVANEKMVQLIREEQRRKGVPIRVTCPDCNQMTGIVEHCEFCNHTGAVTEKQIKERYDELTKGD